MKLHVVCLLSLSFMSLQTFANPSVPGSYDAARKNFDRASAPSSANIPKLVGGYSGNCSFDDEPIPNVAMLFGYMEIAPKKKVYIGLNLHTELKPRDLTKSRTWVCEQLSLMGKTACGFEPWSMVAVSENNGSYVSTTQSATFPVYETEFRIDAKGAILTHIHYHDAYESEMHDGYCRLYSKVVSCKDVPLRFQGPSHCR